MRRRRGLTLVEVLASTVLLAILAATCMPLLRQAMRVLHEPESSFEMFDVSQFADRFIVHPGPGGIKLLSEGDQLELPWPEHPDRAPITVRRMTAGETDTGRAWLTFSCEGRSVSRWVAVERSEDEGQEDKGSGSGEPGG
ncbi:MAG: type II secretion system protein [Planctomycetota bacterium]|jgi:prepilin-type N-terminal cleavage/methylation domain-containing protein